MAEDKRDSSNNDDTAEIVNENRESTEQDILVSSQQTQVISENEPVQPEPEVTISNEESHVVLTESQVTNNNLGNSAYVVHNESQEGSDNKEDPTTVDQPEIPVETESPKHVELSHVDSISSPAVRNKEDIKLENVEIQEEPVQAEAKPAQEVPLVEDLATRINKAISLKEAAKPFVKGALYEEAIKVYESAFYALKMTAQDSSSPDFRNCLILQNDIFNNMSLCYMNLGKHQESISYSKRVLMIEQENIKALFRVATGYKNLGDNLTAYDYIQKCKEAYKRQFPGQRLDTKIHELYLSLKESCKEAIEAREKKEKELFSKMMGNHKKEEEKSEENKADDKKRLAIAKSFSYAPFISHSVILGVIAGRIVQQGSIDGAKKLLPAFLATLCGILFTKFTQNNTTKNIFGFGLAAAAAFMIPKFSK